MELAIALLLWFSVLACGLLAGVYFAFSAFVMAALGGIGPVAGVAAMNAINRVILRSAFMPLFLGSSLSSLALAVIGATRGGEAGAVAMAAGGVVYVLGMAAVTMARNVPLNDALLAADPASQAGAALWSVYLRRWTRWNRVRTVACTVALALFVIAIAERRELLP